MKMAKLFQTKKKLCRTFSTYFANIVSTLQIPSIHEDVSDVSDPVSKSPQRC